MQTLNLSKPSITDATYFIPTATNSFADLLESRLTSIDPVALYDLATFVDAFVLKDRVYIDNRLADMLYSRIQERGSNDAEGFQSIIFPIEDLYRNGNRVQAWNGIVNNPESRARLEELERELVQAERKHAELMLGSKDLPKQLTRAHNSRFQVCTGA